MSNGVDKFGVLVCQCVIGYGKEEIVYDDKNSRYLVGFLYGV
jgi:hypothetical protein